MRVVLLVVGGLLALNTSSLEAQNAGSPRFEDYPVVEIFKGIPAAPILATAEQRMYRTRIRNGSKRPLHLGLAIPETGIGSPARSSDKSL